MGGNNTTNVTFMFSLTKALTQANLGTNRENAKRPRRKFFCSLTVAKRDDPYGHNQHAVQDIFSHTDFDYIMTNIDATVCPTCIQL